MNKRILALLKSEAVLYILVGAMTTAVNYIIFALADRGLSGSGIPETVSYKLAYGLAFSGPCFSLIGATSSGSFETTICGPAIFFRNLPAFSCPGGFRLHYLSDHGGDGGSHAFLPYAGVAVLHGI